MKRLYGLLSALIPVAVLVLCAVPAGQSAYSDLPEGALSGEVTKAVEYGLMNGYSDSVFGYSALMTRAQFVTVLDRLLLFDAEDAPLSDAMKLPDTLSAVYRESLSHAVACDVVDDSAPFRAYDPVTREEMAEMLVKALGLNEAALSLASHPLETSDMKSPAVEKHGTPFQDLPQGREGYAAIAYAIGMTKGTTDTTFSPNQTATRAQVAAMLVRLYEKIHQTTDFRHAFCTFSDAGELALATRADAVSALWSRMTWNSAKARLATNPDADSYCIPENYAEIVQTLSANGVRLYLNVYMDVPGGVTELLSSDIGRTQAVEQIVQEVTKPDYPYSGVTIDFEGLRSAQKEAFTTFLTELHDALSKTGKGLYVCVAPYKSSGWDDGYDFRAIARLADKLILTSYDYHSGSLINFLGTQAYRNEAPASVNDVYLSLRTLTETVPDASKLVLGIHLRNTAWAIDGDDKLISGSPTFPDAQTLSQRLARPDTLREWSAPYAMPYAIYTQDGARYFVWYEDAKSVRKKTDVAKLLDVTGVSYWETGFVDPDALP